MAKSALELLDSNAPVKPVQISSEGEKAKSALSLIEEPEQAKIIEPVQTTPQPLIEPVGLFTPVPSLIRKANEPKPEPEPLKWVQGGKLGEIRDQQRANKLAFDVLKNQYPRAADLYTLQATNLVNLKKVSHDLITVFEAGIGQSIMGRRGKALGYKQPTELTPEQYESMSVPTRFVHDLAAFIGDIPSGVVGGMIGAGAGPVGFLGGFMGMNEGLRSYYDSLIEKGEVKGPVDFLTRVNDVAKQEVKGIAVGKATSVAGEFAGLPAEILTMPTVMAALEARLPMPEEYAQAATFMLGMNVLTKGPRTIGKMRELYRKTGMTPKDLVEETKVNPELKVVLTDDSVEIPENVIAKAKAKVDEAIKVQADLAAAEKVAKNPLTAEEAVKEELKVKGKKVKEAKGIKSKEPTQTFKEFVESKGVEWPIRTTDKDYQRLKDEFEGKEVVDETVQSLNGLKKPSIKSATELIKPEPVKSATSLIEPPTKPKVKNKRGKSTITYSRGGAKPHSIEVGGTFVGDKFVAVDEGTIAFGKSEKTYGVYKDGVQIKGGFDKASEAIKFAEEGKVDTKPVKQPQPITDLDLQTGTPLPKKLSTKEHPFRDKDPQHTNEMSKLYSERIKNADIDPEVFTRYLINEVNKWLNGDEPAAPIEKLRNTLSSAAVNAENVRFKFDRTEDFEIWKDTVREAARWARSSERPKEVKLTMGVDPTQITKITKQLKKEVNRIKITYTKESNKWGKEAVIFTHPDGEAIYYKEGNKYKFPIFTDIGVSREGQKIGTALMNKVFEDMRNNGNRIFYTNEVTSDGIALYEAQERLGKIRLIKEEEVLYDQSNPNSGTYFERMYEIKNLPKPINLYSGLDPIEASKQIIKGISKIRNKFAGKEIPKINIDNLSPEEKIIYNEGKKWNDRFEADRKAKDFDFGRFVDRAAIHTYRAIHERKGMLRNELRKKYGADGDRLVQFIDAADAMDGRADRMYFEMAQEAYSGVSSKLNSHIDAVDLMNRLKDIYNYKSGKEFKPPKDMSPVQTAAFDGMLELYRGLTSEERAQAELVSRIMSDHVKMWVDEMVAVGLKTAEEGEKLKSHDYRKIRSIAIEDMYDQKYKLRLGDKIIKQTDSGVDPLGKKAISLMETDSRILYKETANRIYRRIANQEVKLALKEFDAKFLDNPFVIFKENGKRGVPKEWVRDFWFDNGKLKTYYMHPDVALQLLSSGTHMSFPLTRVLTNVLGVNMTRALTVGTSAIWATTRGITMDMGHSFFSARYFDESGKPIRLFSKFAPVYLGQIGKSMGDTFYDVITRGPKTGVYEKNGGTMPFLAMREQHFLGRGIKAPGFYDKLMDGLSFWGQSMERWNRVAVMESKIKEAAIKKGISLEEAYKDKDIVRQATNTAVERLPYRQGGWLVKEIDKVFGPFISASYNATRTFVRGAFENPVDFWARVSNIAIPTVGATIAMALWAPEAKRDTPEWQHVGGAVFTLFPDTLNFIDENGDKRWINVKLPLDPNISAIYNVFRGLSNKMMYETGMSDIEPDYSAIVDSITRSLPIDSPVSPTLGAWLSYFRNINIWRESKVVPEAFEWPQSGMEGQFDPKLNQLAKDIGKKTGLSGPRLAAAARNIGLQSNEFAWAMGKLYDKVNNDIDPRLREQHWAISLSQAPGFKNLMTVTEPRAYRNTDRKEMDNKEVFESFLRRGELDAKAEGYYWKGVGEESEIDKFIDSFEEPAIRDSLENKRKFIMRVKDLPHRNSWSRVFHTTPEYKAEDYYKIWKTESSPIERIELELELDKLLDAGYVSKDSRGRFYEKLDMLKIEQFIEP